MTVYPPIPCANPMKCQDPSPEHDICKGYGGCEHTPSHGAVEPQSRVA